MDEREMFIAAMLPGLATTGYIDIARRIAEQAADSNDISYRMFKAGLEAGRAARHTTPDREAIIEECAKVCERVAAERNIAEMRSGAELCVGAIRSLKTAPTSDKGGA